MSSFVIGGMRYYGSKDRSGHQRGECAAVTATQLVNGVACLQALQAFLTNASVASSNRNVNVDDLAS